MSQVDDDYGMPTPSYCKAVRQFDETNLQALSWPTSLDKAAPDPIPVEDPVDRSSITLVDNPVERSSITSTIISASQNMLTRATDFIMGSRSSQSSDGTAVSKAPRSAATSHTRHYSPEDLDTDETLWAEVGDLSFEDMDVCLLLDSLAQDSPNAANADRGPSLKRANPDDDARSPSKKRKIDTAPSYYVVAHDDGVVRLLDSQQIPWGVQWEIARHCLLSGVDVAKLRGIKAIKPFQGSNAQVGPKVAEILTTVLKDLKKHNENEVESTLRQFDTSKHEAYEVERGVKDPWTELDKEQAAILREDNSGLGCVDDKSDVYHGKVHLQITFFMEGTKCSKVRLEKPEIGPSTRFARRFGSRRLIRVKFKLVVGVKRATSDQLKEFASQRFVIWGRVYRTFFAKEGTVHLVETDEDYGRRKPRRDEADHLRMSVFDFNQWHNPMALNKNQIMTKWGARQALGLSTSIPGVKILPQNVHRIPDIISPAFDGIGKPPSHVQMTDGCGLINGTAMRIIAQRLEWGRTPAALQGRFGGAKGMFILHPDLDFDGPPAIWIRDSQLKIEYGPVESHDPAMLIMDVIRPPRLACPGKLSAETIIVLSHGGVPSSVFLNFLRTGLSEHLERLVDWEGKDAPEKLWHALSGGVMRDRMRRFAAGGARAKGLGMSIEEDNDPTDEDIHDVSVDRSTAWWVDQISGCPSSMEETVMEVLDAGFTPQNCKFMRNKMRQILNTSVEAFVSRHKLRVPQSAEGFIVPDPVGVLKEGEVYLRMSHPVIDERTGMEIDVITGPVLILRHPCKLPSDVRKVMAVDRPELRHWKDLVILSTEGQRSEASNLAGGDYDGDTVTLYWDQDIVGPFTNASLHFANPPESIAKSFIRSTEQVSEFLDSAQNMTRDQVDRRIQDCLLGALQTSRVGLWSKFHDIAVYKYGLADERTIFLAYMFTTCLDGAKSGLKDLDEVFRRATIMYGVLQEPNWKQSDEDRKKYATDGRNKLPIPIQPKFVMEKLANEGEQLVKTHLQLFEASANKASKCMDDDLVAPWNDARLASIAKGAPPAYRTALDAIQEHVEDVRRCHRAAFTKEPPKKGAAKDRENDKHAFTAQNITVRQDVLRALSNKFAQGPDDDKVRVLYQDWGRERVELIKASYAYLHDWKKVYEPGGTSFPFDVALRKLCEIKAKASGLPTKTVIRPFYEKFTMHKGFVKA